MHKRMFRLQQLSTQMPQIILRL